MSSSSRTTFVQQVREQTERGRILSPEDMARLALACGVSLTDYLATLRAQSQYRERRNLESDDALVDFVTSVCRSFGATNVLEYAWTLALTTAPLAEAPAPNRLDYVVPYAGLAAALNIVLESRPNAAAFSLGGVPSQTNYDAIICSPPMVLSTAESNDFFGGAVVAGVVPLLAQEGLLFWITGRGVLFQPKGTAAIASLAKQGIHLNGIIELPPGALHGAMIDGVVLVLQRQAQDKRFLAVLRDRDSTRGIARALKDGPSKREGACWLWTDAEDPRSFVDIERSRTVSRLTPRGKQQPARLAAILADSNVEKADRPIKNSGTASAPLFIPEYAGSHVATDLDELSVKPNAVYRLSVDPAKANARFLAHLLNSPFGRELRGTVAQGATIQRISLKRLLDLELPIPDIATQDKIAGIYGDVALLNSALREFEETLNGDWTALADVTEKIDRLKGVLDIDRQIADWSQELPYPLATIYRRYQVQTEPKERLDTILHFFEMAAVYLAVVGASHVKALRSDWQEVLAKWLRPTGGGNVERTDFGFWIQLAQASLKDLARISGDKELRDVAIEIGGPDLLQAAATLSELSRANRALDVARSYRNSWKGHGGLMKTSDAARLDSELQQSLRDFYEATASIFRRFLLVRPGGGVADEEGFTFQVELLVGSDPTFKRNRIQLTRPSRSHALAFWMTGSTSMCRALPFFRMGAPQRPQETSIYVFNRLEKGGMRWISFQEAREQEVIEVDDELMGIISLRRGST